WRCSRVLVLLFLTGVQQWDDEGGGITQGALAPLLLDEDRVATSIHYRRHRQGEVAVRVEARRHLELHGLPIDGYRQWPLRIEARSAQQHDQHHAFPGWILLLSDFDSHVWPERHLARQFLLLHVVLRKDDAFQDRAVQVQALDVRAGLDLRTQRPVA